MPIPTDITDLDVVAANNSPAGSDSPTEGDNYIRALSAIIAQEHLDKVDAGDLADPTSASNGPGKIGRGLLDYAAGTVGADLMVTVHPSGSDDTANWQAAVDFCGSRGLPIRIKGGAHSITTVNIGRYGCDIRLDPNAVVTVNGDGVQRELLQTPRATFIAANALLDATNYYWTMRVSGGRFICGAGDTAISDRVPFLVNTGASPSQIMLQRNLLVDGVDITLNDATSIGIGIHGGWGPTVRGGSITAAGIDAIAINIGGSSADGDTSCHPQEILVDGVTFNSCRPFASAKGGCTNSAEGLTVRGCWFNFVRLAELTGINSINWLGGNQFVTDTKSLDIVDSSGVTVTDNYFESNHDPDNASKPGIVNFENCQDIKFSLNKVNVLATSTSVARDGILIKANNSTVMRGIDVSHNRFQHATYSVTLETNAIRCATDGGTGQLLDVTLKDNCCNEWHNAINFTDHITTLATGVRVENVTNNGGVKLLKGVARIAPTGFAAPMLWEQFSTYLHGQSSGSGTVVPAASDVWPTVMPRTTNPTVTVTNFTNAANAQSIVATWAAIGANSVHIVMNQTAASAANATVEASATITIDGTTV